jgi:hypothetical protein
VPGAGADKDLERASLPLALDAMSTNRLAASCSTRILAGAVTALTLVATAPFQAHADPGLAALRAYATTVSAGAAEVTPRLVLSGPVVQVSGRYGVGFVDARCNEPAQDFCSLAARLYHAMPGGPSRQLRIGTVAGTAAGGASGRLGFIMNVRGWQLLRARRHLTVTLRGTIVHGEMLTGHVDQKIRLSLG